jgi:hypothetical protein
MYLASRLLLPLSALLLAACTVPPERALELPDEARQLDTLIQQRHRAAEEAVLGGALADSPAGASALDAALGDLD